MHRTRGGIVAGAFFVIPSIFILLALSSIYAAHGQVAAVAGVLAGFKPVIVAIVVEAVVKIGRRALKRPVHHAIAATAFLAIYVLHVPLPLIVLPAALLGLLGARLWPQVFDPPAGPPTPVAPATAGGPHTVPSAPQFARTLAIGLALWLVPLLLLGAWRGWSSLHAHAYRFFTLAAFVTFGGAYSVLAYVTQVATTSLGWLTRAQAVDGWRSRRRRRGR